MTRLAPPAFVEPEIPAELTPPATPAHEIAALGAAAPGQLVELRDGQQVLLLSLGQTGEATTATGLRVGWARGTVQPLGETVALGDKDPAAQGPLQVLGAWYSPQRVPQVERVLLEAIRRGFITRRTCGVPWPLALTWQLSAQAAEQIEKYLFQVARSTGTAFPFHDITRAMQQMHLQLSPHNPGLCDIVSGESPGRQPTSDAEMLSVWARDLQRRVHASELVLSGPSSPAA